MVEGAVTVRAAPRVLLLQLSVSRQVPPERETGVVSVTPPLCETRPFAGT